MYIVSARIAHQPLMQASALARHLLVKLRERSYLSYRRCARLLSFLLTTLFLASWVAPGNFRLAWLTQDASPPGAMARRIDIRGNAAQAGSTQVSNVNFSTGKHDLCFYTGTDLSWWLCTGYNNDNMDHVCLSALRCPDTLVVKNRLKENKDKLLHKAFN
jgi:hypothetical protein